MSGRKVSAIKIKDLRYATVLSAKPTKTTVKAAFEAATKIENSHQGTFTYEETEATVNKYKNQLTGQVYRSDIEEGEVTVKFTVGQYDFATKAALMGGSGDDDSWERGKCAQNYKCMYALTEDDVLIVFPKANAVGTGSSTDNAIGIAMQFIPEEPGITGTAMEYWFDYNKLT